jgi:hypothetical protein
MKSRLFVLTSLPLLLLLGTPSVSATNPLRTNPLRSQGPDEIVELPSISSTNPLRSLTYKSLENKSFEDKSLKNKPLKKCCT